MNNIASWIWVLIPLAAIGIAPFKMWLRIKEKQIEAQSSLAAEKSAQYAAHVERIEARVAGARADRHRSAARKPPRRSRRCASRPRIESGDKVQMNPS